MQTIRIVEETSHSQSLISDKPLQELQALATFGVIASPTLVITPETLTTISTQTSLTPKIATAWQASLPITLESQEKMEKKIISLFKHLTIPSATAKHILRHCHTLFKKQYVMVYSGHHGIAHPTLCHENVVGDTNIIQSILDVWRDVVILQLKQPIAHFTPKMVCPFSIAVQLQYQADASGIAYSRHPLTGDSNHIVIRSIHGVQPYKEIYEKTDTFTISTSGWQIVTTKKSTQVTAYARKPDVFIARSLTVKQQNQLSITQEQAISLAKIIQTIKQHFVEHKKIWWSLYNGAFIIVGLTTHHTDLPEKIIDGKAIPTRTQIFFTLPSAPQQIEIDSKVLIHTDGIGQISGNTLLTQTGIHPMHSIRRKNAYDLQQETTKALTAIIEHTQAQVCLYHAYNLSSQYGKILQHSELYEAEENNPMMGFRGAVRTLFQPELFMLELEVIKEAIQQTHATIGMAVSFIRSPQELAYIKQLIAQAGLTENDHFQLWLILSTPENCLNLEQYPLEGVTGVIFDTYTIHGLILGIDHHQSELAEQYPLNISGIEKLLTLTTTALHTKQLANNKLYALLLDVTQYDSELVRMAVDAQATGIIVTPPAIIQAKTVLYDRESRPKLSSSPNTIFPSWDNLSHSVHKRNSYYT